MPKNHTNPFSKRIESIPSALVSKIAKIDELKGGLAKGSDAKRTRQGSKMQKDATASLDMHDESPLFFCDRHDRTVLLSGREHRGMPALIIQKARPALQGKNSLRIPQTMSRKYFQYHQAIAYPADTRYYNKT